MASVGDLRVSVIVPVRNAGEDLPTLLECLSRQTEQSFEIVIGDDGSDDGSLDALAQLDGPNVRVVRGPPLNAYATRNRAVAESPAPILAFCDADCRPDPHWLECGLTGLESADVVAGRIGFRHSGRRRYLVACCISRGAKLAFAEDAAVTHPVRTSARSFLRNVWSMNSSYAAFESRAGRLPEGLRLREWIPIVQTVRARQRFGMSLGPRSEVAGRQRFSSHH